MTLKKWIYLFWTTLVWGTATAVIAALLLIAFFDDFSFLEVTKAGFNASTVIFAILGGALISIVSQAGFFAYLTVRYIAVGIFRNKRVWEIIQLFLVAVTAFDFIYLSYSSFPQEGESWAWYTAIPIVLLLVSLAVSIWKSKQTNYGAFVPTLFFMYTVTVIEAIPALRMNSMAASIYMMVTLAVCNTWQIMILHKLLQNKKELQAAHN